MTKLQSIHVNERGTYTDYNFKADEGEIMFDVFGYSTNPEIAKRQLEDDYLEDFTE